MALTHIEKGRIYIIGPFPPKIFGGNTSKTSLEPLHDTGFACQARFTFCNPIPIDPNLKESTKPVMLRPVYGKNIEYHCLRQGNRIACFRVKLMETINKIIGYQKMEVLLLYTAIFGGGGFPYINQIGEYLYFTYLKRLVKQLLVFQVYETPRCRLSPASMAPLPRYRPRRLGAGGKEVPAKSTKQSGWSLG